METVLMLIPTPLVSARMTLLFTARSLFVTGRSAADAGFPHSCSHCEGELETASFRAAGFALNHQYFSVSCAVDATATEVCALFREVMKCQTHLIYL